MKWLMILALVISCTSHKKEESAGESNAEQVSPYTVQPCYCMKIFQPVCGADKKNYGNSCEAECHGNKSWTEGSCSEAPQKKK